MTRPSDADLDSLIRAESALDPEVVELLRELKVRRAADPLLRLVVEMYEQQWQQMMTLARLIQHPLVSVKQKLFARDPVWHDAPAAKAAASTVLERDTKRDEIFTKIRASLAFAYEENK